MSVAALDVHYEPGLARAAAVVASDLSASAASAEHTLALPDAAPYQPGAFFQRELPCLRAVLAVLAQPPALVVIDGYVWLDGDGAPGLGAHLSRALGDLPVIGVAKTSFRGADFAQRVLRGTSLSPLFVTAVGVDPAQAAAWVAAMHGPHRVPTLLRRVDQLARGLAQPVRA